MNFIRKNGRIIPIREKAAKAGAYVAGAGSIGYAAKGVSSAIKSAAAVNQAVTLAAKHNIAKFYSNPAGAENFKWMARGAAHEAMRLKVKSVGYFARSKVLAGIGLGAAAFAVYSRKKRDGQ